MHTVVGPTSPKARGSRRQSGVREKVDEVVRWLEGNTGRVALRWSQEHDDCHFHMIGKRGAGATLEYPASLVGWVLRALVRRRISDGAVIKVEEMDIRRTSAT